MSGKPCVQVEKSRAQHVKAILLKHRLLDPARQPARDAGNVLFPVVSAPDAAVMREIGQPFDVVHDCTATPARVARGTLSDRLAGTVPGSLLSLVPRSFNITGHVCILELDPEIHPFRASIASELVRLHPNVTTVYAKIAERAGEARTSQLELVHGPDDPLTTHVENGFTYQFDAKLAFFDPRLANEHARVTGALAARTGIAVLDAYCGVGPFVVPLSVVPGMEVLAVDSNPVAIDCLRQNITRNKGNPDAVRIACADAREIMEDPATVKEKHAGFDAILMNLPRRAHEHLAPASRILAPSGRIYWYTIAHVLSGEKAVHGKAARAVAASPSGDDPTTSHNPVDGILAEGLGIAGEAGLIVDAITRVKPYAPYRYIHCVELVHGSST